MKKLQLLFALFVLLFVSSKIFSQGIPETINYQGVLKDASGVIVPNGDYNITFNLYDVSAGGTALWSETKLISIDGGIVNTQLGSVTPIPQSVLSGAAWLGITIEAGSELTPRIALTSVPYSFYTMNVADGKVVKSLNGLTDDVNLVAGANVTITPSGNNLTINATGGGGGTIGGSGTNNYIPKFTGSSEIGNSNIFQAANNNIGIDDASPNYKLTINTSGSGGLGLKIHRTGGTNLLIKSDSSPVDEKGWAFNVFNTKLQIRTIADDDVATLMNVMTFQRDGNVGIGTTAPESPLHVVSSKLYSGYFSTNNSTGVGVLGKNSSTTGETYGVLGESSSTENGAAVRGNSTFVGVWGQTSGRWGVYGHSSGTSNSYGVFGSVTAGTGNYAGYFLGNVNVTGTLSKGGGSFKIDHPLDPTNKNLYHSFVESPDMMNIYNGNVVTDGSGYATITMPDWFEALNQDFRYQLTVIGDFAQAIVAQKIQNNQFVIRTDIPGIEVSWQVTGIRHDKFAEKYRIPVEENKTGNDVGKYLHPEAYGVSETMGVDYGSNSPERQEK